MFQDKKRLSYLFLKLSLKIFSIYKFIVHIKNNLKHVFGGHISKNVHQFLLLELLIPVNDISSQYSLSSLYELGIMLHSLEKT